LGNSIELAIDAHSGLPVTIKGHRGVSGCGYRSIALEVLSVTLVGVDRPLGYLNIIDRSEGRQIRTITIDPERVDLVRLAFDMYTTGDNTLADLSDELYGRGLRT